jgi:hypothetical protein
MILPANFKQTGKKALAGAATFGIHINSYA